MRVQLQRDGYGNERYSDCHVQKVDRFHYVGVAAKPSLELAAQYEISPRQCEREPGESLVLIHRMQAQESSPSIHKRQEC